MEFFISILKFFVGMDNIFFSKIDAIINSLPFSVWANDAIIDSIHMLPFLFIIFLLIELIEYKYSDKINLFIKSSKNAGPVIGSLIASVPQCGFSVIASTLYTKKFITRGTLLAVYLATSDEAIPVLLTQPDSMNLILTIILIKLIIGVSAGYITDIIPTKRRNNNSDEIDIESSGCCRHNLSKPDKSELILHPIMHTLNVFLFILLISLIINYILSMHAGFFSGYIFKNSIFQPIITALAGLIPNCAISVAITMMYLKGIISFGSVISGLCAGAGLGILVLFKRNDSIYDSVKILFLLLIISSVTGMFIEIFI